ncbi:E1 protein [human papillomavirus 101]|uniref:Replication protein E1 n=1 Tax=human papillomavirus 101 TaxID=915425 RepID=Q1AHS0_9PAPI|nr:E1 protein [human papillomavirus 101]AAZ39508.1 E1 protein [human papillomavirus 101]
MEDKDNKGTSPHICDYNAIDFIDAEAACEELDPLEAVLEESDGTDISDLIDNTEEPDEGNSLALLNKQQLEDDTQQLKILKRKYFSPSPKQQAVIDLSPRLQQLRVSSQGSSKRRLVFEDSGLGNETEDSVTEVAKVASEQPLSCNPGEPETNEDVSTDVETRSGGPCGGTTTSNNNSNNNCIDLLHSSNREATAYAKFKATFDVGYKELTRPFISNKSCCCSWIAGIFGVVAEILEAAKTLLQPHCEYLQIINPSMGTGVTVMMLFQFYAAKCRDTVINLLCNVLHVREWQIITNPPKHRSVAVALYFYKTSMSNVSYCYGAMPEWIKKQTLVNHQQESDNFEFATMVQWAYDNNIRDEAEVAYGYASLADDDTNAAAWLKCNNQFKYVKDCVQMVAMYKRYEMRNMTIGQWLVKCGERVTEEGNWKNIINFLKYQEISIVAFLTTLRYFLQGRPKKNCLAIWGPPDTGKSMFCYSLIKYTQGKVVSFVNSRSQFWLQPLVDGKIGLIDDATFACYQYMDVYMRNGLDGNAVSVDVKHKAPIQLKLPPLLLTSNIEVHAEAPLKYLHSRIQEYKFPNKLRLDANGNPIITITDADWKSFFSKLWKQLDLGDPDDSSDGDPGRPFRCCARQATGDL